MTKNKATHGVRERFEQEAEAFHAIYRLDRSPLARWFDRIFRKAIFQRYEMAFDLAGDVRGKSVLDIGCGSGVYVVDFARRGARRVVGLDFSERMLDLARREIELHGVGEVCELRNEDFLEAPVDEIFDVSIAMGVFDYVSDPVPFLRKMVSLTREQVIASFPAPSRVREPARRLRYRLAGKGDVYFYSERELRRIVEETGLTEYRLIPIDVSGRGHILAGRPTRVTPS